MKRAGLAVAREFAEQIHRTVCLRAGAGLFATKVLKVYSGAICKTALAALFGIFGSALSAQEDSYTDGEKLFALKVKPLLRQKCFACHGGEDEVKGRKTPY